MLPAVLHVPAATLVETYSTSTQYLMHILFMNTHILLGMHNSIIISHKHDFFSLIMVQIFNSNTLKIAQLKSMRNGRCKVLAAA